MNNKLQWLTSSTINLRFMWQVIVRLSILVIAFNGLYLVIQPLDNSALTLYNHIIPGRLRLPWSSVSDSPAPVANEVRLTRLIADHVISMPKQPNEYRVVFLGSSEVWGYRNRPQDTMPVVIDSMSLKVPDGRIIKGYNLAYVGPDIFKDLLILDAVLRTVDKPDLVILTVNPASFQKTKLIHYLAQANPEDALRLKQTYNLTSVEDVAENTWLAKNTWLATHNFWAERSDVVGWITNQVYGITWAESQTDYPAVYLPYTKMGFGGKVAWKNDRTGVLNAMLSLTTQNHIPLLLVSVPINYASDFAPWIQSQARELSIPLLDCSALLSPEYFTNGWYHITAEGQRRDAENVSEWLQTWLRRPNMNGQMVTSCPSWRMEF